MSNLGIDNGQINGAAAAIELPVAGRAPQDTIRVWDHYRQKAAMWRLISLLQVPVSAVAILATMVMFFSAKTIVETPPIPQPGVYNARELSDAEYVNFAIELVNLFATYHPGTAKVQFETATRYLWDPALSEFERSVIGKDLPILLETRRSQLFLADERLVHVNRHPKRDLITVRLPGVQSRMVSGRILPEEDAVYYITMTTVPRSVENKYGIVAIHVRGQLTNGVDVTEINWKDPSLGQRPASAAGDKPSTSETGGSSRADGKTAQEPAKVEGGAP